MKMLKKHSPVILLILLFPALLMMKSSLVPGPKIPDVWKAYVPVLVEKGAKLSEGGMESFFQELGWDDIISRDSQDVVFFDYDGEKTVSYNQLEEYVLPQDQRFDEYLRGLGGYFEGSIDGSPAEVLYIGNPSGSETAWRQTEKALEKTGSSYYIPLAKTGGGIYYWPLIILNMLMFLILIPVKGRLLFLFGAAAALPWTGTMQFPLFALNMLQISGWALLSGWAGDAFARYLNIGYESLKRDFMFRLYMYTGCAVAGLGVAVSSFQYTSSGMLILLSLTSSAAHAALLYLYYLLIQRRFKRQQHTLFFPVPMRRETKRNIFLMWRCTAVIVTAVVLPTAVFHLLGNTPEREVIYPQPYNINSDSSITDCGLDWEKTARFAGTKKPAYPPGDGLPDLTDYIKHRAYQEGYLYGREYEFPYQDEKIILRMYEKQGIKIFEQDKVFKIFTEMWYDGIITDASKNGVSRLLYAQNRAVQIVKRKINTFRIPTHTIIAYVGIFLLIGPFVYMYVSAKMNGKNLNFEKYQHKKGQKVA